MAVIRGLVILFLVFSLEYAAAKTCSVGWQRFGAKCFRFFPQTVNWGTAVKNCQNFGGNLASVRTKVRNDFLLSLVPSNTRAWIGGHDGELDGQWLWSNGARFDYTNWCRGEPNNDRRPENCLELNFSGNRCWNDESCSIGMGYICARKPK
ncbi:galactose-specific lectin nattectin-like [Triplophysa dalaica]|uniref:galactose-specific lectin nattectin-like n=1 Tax=Triplophysa dalaica TaxID=1582913 RepID=UPI0024DF6384|nr:galactose-specific lectin nattectin-like [Triplophysa dalaica]XP_056611326.1 galactose-specific lectin nattectin-like [Triplophysa dalaica]XP_056611327.1 galactose-specific lectin nattectin-like [Triplophysa dalaica]XP_056611328.1 galactose-specific lectin nattectin-like [Triplophysa dalaica]